MAFNEDISSQFREDFRHPGEKRGVKVYDDDAQQALNSIVSVLERKFGEVTNKVNKLETESTKTAHKETNERKTELVRSLAAEKNNRAVQNALNGDLKKGFSLISTLKDLLKKGLDELISIVVDGFKKTLRHFDDMSADLRKKNISHEDKVNTELLVTQAKTVDGGFNVATETLSKLTTDMAGSNQAMFRQLVDQVKSGDKNAATRLNAVAKLVERGASSEDAMKLLSNFRADQTDELKKVVATATSSTMNGAGLDAFLKTLNSDNVATKNALSKDFAGMMQSVATSASIMNQSTSAFSGDNLSSLLELGVQLKQKQVYSVNEEALIAKLGITGGKVNSPEDIVKGLQNKLAPISDMQKKAYELEKAGRTGEAAALRQQAQEQADELRNAITPVALENKILGDAMISALNEAQAGNFNTNIKNQEQIIADSLQADKDNTANGKIQNVLEKVTAGLNNITGGLLGRSSVFLDELTGGDVTMETIVTKGFGAVLDLLSKLALAFTLKNLASSLIPGLSGGLAGGLTGGFKSLLTRIGPHVLKFAGGAAAIGLAATAIYAAAATFNDTSERWENVEKTEQAVKDAQKRKSDAELKLALAKKSGNQADIAKYTAELNQANKTLADAQTAAQDAWNKRSASTETATNFENKTRDDNRELMEQRAEWRRLQKVALESGDTAGAEKADAKAKELNALIEKNNARVRIVNEESNNALTMGVAGLFKVFGGELTAEDMESWHNFKQDVSNFFTETIPNFFTKTIPKFFTETIPNTFKSLGTTISNIFNKYIIQPVTKAVDRISSWIDENLVQPVTDAIDRIGSWLDENIIQPVTDAIDSIGSWLNENIVQPLVTLKNDICTFITDNFVTPLKEFFDFDWLPGPVKKFLFDDDYGATDLASDLASSALDTAKDFLNDGVDFVKGLWPFADGGVVDKATPAVVGEAGREAILPLTNPDALHDVLMSLKDDDKKRILSALIDNPNLLTSTTSISGSTLATLFSEIPGGILNIFNRIKDFFTSDNSAANNSAILDSLPKNNVPGDDPATIEKILSYAGPYRQQVWELIDKGRTNKPGYGFKRRKEWYKEALANAANQEGRELIRGTYAERALEYGVTQLGKPYILRSLGKIGYVCNELVNACVKASGFDMKKFMVHGVKATFANIQKGKYSDNNTYADFRLRPDLTPETATPGMVFFQDGRKNKEGGFQPGHIGLVYYGHQKLHSSGGSAKYDKNTFLPNWQTPCRGVTVTPFDGGDYMIGEFPDLFKQATGEWNPPKDSPTKFGPQPVSTAEVRKVENEGVKTDIPENATLAEQKRLAKEAIESVVKNADADVKTTAKQYAEQAALLLNGNNTAEVVESLSAIIHYLKTIASSPANKRNFTPVSKPMSSVY